MSLSLGGGGQIPTGEGTQVMRPHFVGNLGLPQQRVTINRWLTRKVLRGPMGRKVCVRVSAVFLLRSRTPKDPKSVLLAFVAICPPVSSRCPFSECVQLCVHVSPSGWSRWGCHYVSVAALRLHGPSDLASSASQGVRIQVRSTAPSSDSSFG